jgi:hypothetical protein
MCDEHYEAVELTLETLERVASEGEFCERRRAEFVADLSCLLVCSCMILLVDVSRWILRVVINVYGNVPSVA